MGFTADDLLEVAFWAFDNVTGKIPLVGSSADLARDYMEPGTTLGDQIDSLINWQSAKTFGTGFIAGIPGFTMLPATIPADISALFYNQLRMVSAIAFMSGITDLSNDKVKTVCVACLIGEGVTDALKEAGVKLGSKIANQLIGQIPGTLIKAINKQVGFRLVTKFGTTGIVNLSKVVPVLSGIIGGTVNAIGTQAVGYAAKEIFAGTNQERLGMKFYDTTASRV